jgi:large subunit ribosomal protein L29
LARRRPARPIRRSISSTSSQAKEELFNLRFQSATGQLDNHGRCARCASDIARVYTVLRERELGIVAAKKTT